MEHEIPKRTTQLHNLIITTCNRPELLKESLEAVLWKDKATTLNRILVLDDSTDPEVVAHNRTLIHDDRGNRGLEVMHVDHETKNQLTREYTELSGGSVPQSVLQDVLFTPQCFTGVAGSGCNRNAGLLLTAGERYISIDDDARLEFSALSDSGSLDFVMEKSFDGNYASGMIDKLSRMNDLIEPFAGNVVEIMDLALDVTGDSPAKRTRLAMTGIMGRRWFDYPWTIIRSAGVFHDEVFYRRARYRRARLSGYAATQPSRAFVINYPLLVTCCYAADSSDILPPFPPAVRTDDTIFSLLVHACYPDNLIAHIPAMVNHDLGAPRPFTKRDLLAPGLRFGDLITLIVRYLVRSEPYPDAESAMIHLGKKMQELGTLDHNEWSEFTRSLWLEQSGMEISALEGLLEKFNETPRFWAQDVHSRIDQIRQEASGLRHMVPREWQQTHSPEQAGALQRSFFQTYSEILLHWPAIWRIARERNEALR